MCLSIATILQWFIIEKYDFENAFELHKYIINKIKERKS